MRASLAEHHLLAPAVLFLALCLWPSTITAAEQPPVVLSNDLVSLEFQPPRMGLSSMTDRVAGIEHIREDAESPMLWELVFAHGMQERVLRNTGFDCTRRELTPLPGGGQRLRMEWRGLDLWKEGEIMDVVVTVDLPADRGIAEWRISVDNRSDAWGLMEVRFPFFSGFLAPGEYDLAIPDVKTGSLHRGASGVLTNYFGYPSSGWPMAFLCACLGDAGIYLAAHDPEAWYKRYRIEPGGNFYFTTFVENMGEPGTGYDAHYPAHAGVYTGGWMDACKLYRNWALGQAWGSAGPLSAREDVPRSIRELGLWLVYGIGDFVPVEQRTKTLYDHGESFLEAARYFDFPIGIQWYNWHRNRFDNQYPEYPPRPGFREVTRRAHEAGLLLAPYINAMSVDYDPPSYWEDLHPLAVKDRTGKAEIVFYGDFASRMTWMCVSTPAWHDIVTALVDSLTGYWECNSLYLDQVAAARPQLCFDRSHGHPTGGGGWWARDLRELCRKAKEVAAPRRAPLTTEFFCEVYIDCMDAFLTWEPPDENQIPMVPAVYGGRTICYGSPMNLEVEDDIFRSVQARDFLWGRQVGWIGFGLFDDPAQRAKLEWLGKLGGFRMLSHKYLTYGEFLGMLDFDSPVDSVSGVWAPPGVLNRQEIRGPAPMAQGALWLAEDGCLGVILVNCLERSCECAFHLDPEDHAFAPDRAETYGMSYTGLSGEGGTEREVSMPFEWSGTLEAGEIRLIELAPL